MSLVIGAALALLAVVLTLITLLTDHSGAVTSTLNALAGLSLILEGGWFVGATLRRSQEG